jgi:hypothetical protein
LTQTFPDDFAEAISLSEAVGVGAGLDEAFFGGAMVLAEADVDGAVEDLEEAAVDPPAVEPPDDAGEAESEAEAAELDFLLFFVEPVLAEASAAGALGFDASAAGAAVASLDALSDFLLRFDFLAGEASAAVAELSVAAASVSDFFFRFDFLVVEASAVAAEVSAAAASASAFLLFFDFFGAEASVVAAELSAESASAFLLFFDDFFVVELSAGAAEVSAEAASAFLDFFDFFLVVVV